MNNPRLAKRDLNRLFFSQRHLWDSCQLHLFQLYGITQNRKARIRHQCTKSTVTCSHRHLINAGVEINELHLNID
jgi:hypothetical protein